MPGLLSGALMGPSQLLRQPQAAPMQAMAAPQASGGLLSMINPNIGQNPIYQRFDQNRDVLANMFLGGVGAESPLERMRGMAGGVAKGRETSRMLQMEREKQQKEQAAINRTIELLGQKRPDLVPWVEAGAIGPAEAFKTLYGDSKATDDIQEYQFAVQQGFQGTFTDYMTEQKKAGASSVTINDGTPGLGKLSTDYGYKLGPDGKPVIGPDGLPIAAAIPNSPAWQEIQKAQEASGAKADSRTTKSDTITTAADTARKLISRTTTGTPGRIMATALSESDAAELRRQAAVLKSNATIENLQAMRAASPTGGALGNVSDSEGAMLAAAAGALDPDASPEQFKQQLDNYERTLLRIVHGPAVGDAIFEQKQQGWTDLGNGVRIRKLD